MLVKTTEQQKEIDSGRILSIETVFEIKTFNFK